MSPPKPRRRIRVLCSAACLAAFFFLASSGASPAPADPLVSSGAPADGRVIVLGFDGADARTAAAMMDAGELPNLRRLADSGTFAPLRPSNPAESPVSWASLNCGQNPAKTGVPGFVRRKLIGSSANRGRPSPDFGHLRSAKIATEDLSHNPLPSWNPALVAGLAFFGFLIVFTVLLRLKVVGVILALLLGGVGYFGGVQLRSYTPSEFPKYENPLEAQPFWEHAAANGVDCVVLDAAQSFDREPVDGARVLAGLGVPDARGSVNSFFVYTTDELVFERAPKGDDTSSGGVVYRVDERDGVIATEVYGPTNFWKADGIQKEIKALGEKLDSPDVGYKQSLVMQEQKKELQADLAEAEDVRTKVPMTIRRQGQSAEITIDGQTQTLAEGEWSDWFKMSFELNAMLHVKAVTRVKLLHLAEPHFELYMNAIEIDPEAPPFWQPISQPHGFASELAGRVGTFETVGWACMNLPLKDQLVSPETFLEDIEFTLNWREEMTFDALARDDWRVLMSCFSTPDRVQHMMYQYYDESHPLYDAEAAARTLTFFGETITLAEAIPAIFRQVDRLVGRVMDEHLRPEDTLIVCADHGFQSFRRQVHLNNWLVEKGFMKIKPGLRRGRADFLTYVDWSATEAYSLGLGMVYVNQKGRESEGIVDPEAAGEVMDRIRAAFVASKDQDTGELFGAEAYVVSDIHSGSYLDREADMLLTFKPGYRISWGTTTGGLSVATDDEGQALPGPTCADNDKTWSGDHVSVDPGVVEGIFFSNRTLAMPAEGADLRHVAPTVLSLVGVPIPPEYDLPALVVQ